MNTIRYHSESREWYAASAAIMFVTLACYSIISYFALPDQSQTFPIFVKAINISFLLLGFSGLFLAYQGYRFRENKAFLSKESGEKIILSLEKLLLSNNLTVKKIDCISAPNFGLWQPIGRLSLESGEIEVKEIWFSAFFYGTQISFRGDFPDEIIGDFLSSL